MTLKQLSQLFAVSERSIRMARFVIRAGVPELAAMVQQGDLAVSVAAKIAKLPADEQRRMVADAVATGNPKRALSKAIATNQDESGELRALKKAWLRANDDDRHAFREFMEAANLPPLVPA